MAAPAGPGPLASIHHKRFSMSSRQLLLLLSVYIQCSLVNAGGVTYSRGDKEAYLIARRSGSDLKDDPFHYKQIRAKSTDPSTSNANNYDDPDPCNTYLAPSSIPLAGLGLYTSKAIPKETLLGTPQLGILLQDPDFHDPSRAYQQNLLGNYVWSATPLRYGEHEVQHGESVCVGIGMMANCHYGLINVDHYSKWKNEPWLDGTDNFAVEGSKFSTMEDVGRGGYTWHSGLRYKSLRDLEAGEEMFLNYGPQWYENAEKEFGGFIPSKDHYEQADEILETFARQYNDNKRAYELILKNTDASDKRLRTALPDRVEDVPAAIDMGTARFSARDSIRSQQWLKENGACLDNLAGGTSTIPQAGKGAFATKSISKGGVITTTPLVTMGREHLKLFKERNGRRREAGHQLILNYFFGHPDSSLLFFPTAPSVSLINHANRKDANAMIRWSTLPYHKSEWLNSSLEEMKKKEATGLLFDIIATRDISRGEEILLYYGEEWEERWAQHIVNWESKSSSRNFTDTLGAKTIVDFNTEGQETIKTVAEFQQESLNNPGIMTRCGFGLPGDADGLNVGKKLKGYSTNDPKFVPCEILDYGPIEGTNTYAYQAKVEHTSNTGEKTLYSVKYELGQNFMVYTDKPYFRDYYRKGAFRQFIGLSDEIVPSQWMDL